MFSLYGQPENQRRVAARNFRLQARICKRARKPSLTCCPTPNFGPSHLSAKPCGTLMCALLSAPAQHEKTPQAAMDEQRIWCKKNSIKPSRAKICRFFPRTPIYIIAALCLVRTGLLARAGAKADRNIPNGAQRSHRRIFDGRAVDYRLFAADRRADFSLAAAGFCDYDVLHAPRYAGLEQFPDAVHRRPRTADSKPLATRLIYRLSAFRLAWRPALPLRCCST